MIGQRDLERRIDCFGARIGEEHMIEVAGSQRRNARCKLKGLRMAELKRWREIQLARLFLDRLHDGRAIVAGVAAPKACCAIQHLAAIGCRVMHVLGGYEHPRCLLELAVRCKWHPEGVQVVGRGLAVKWHGGLIRLGY